MSNIVSTEQMIVFRNSSGVVRNIGEWDYLITQDDEGNDVVNNPLPSTYTSQIETVNIMSDGSHRVESP